MRPLQKNELEVKDAFIIVQSCDEKVAHIGVQWRGQFTYYHVALPSLEREWCKVYYNELRPAIFDSILQENKSSLLEVIRRLNAAEQGIHLPAFGAELPASNSLQMSLFAEVPPDTIGGR